jgi:hypothetical protein
MITILIIYVLLPFMGRFERKLVLHTSKRETYKI